MSPGKYARVAVALLACVVAVAAAIADGDSAPERIVLHTSSAFYDNIFVVDTGNLRALRFGSTSTDNQSIIRRGHPEQLPMPYLRSAAVGLGVPPRLRRMLMVGLGGGAFASFVSARMPQVHIDAVEIDPVVAQIARTHFALPDSDLLSLHVMDAVDFVQREHAPYDYILLDGYDADEIPEALLTNRFLANVRRHLAEDGIVVANVAVDGTREARDVMHKLAGHFHFCARLGAPPRYNDVLFLTLNSLPDVEALAQWAREFDIDSEARFGLEDYVYTGRPCFGKAS